jgi:alpha-2-macroglobulin
MKLARIFLLAILVIITSCSGGKKIKVTDKNFEEEIQPKTMLSFTFSDDIVPDSLVGVWTNIEYIRFDPKIEGKYHWQTKNVLVFAPTTEFAPATSYSAKLTGEIFRYIKKGRFSGDKEFSFHTPYLKVLSSRAYWDASTDAGGGIKIDIEFNYPVQPTEAAKLLKIKIDNEEKDIQLLTGEASDKITVLAKGIKREDKDYKLEVTLDKGLAPGEGTEKMSEPYVQQFDIPSPFKLEIVDIQANHDGNEGIVTLYTTQEVVAENIKKFISINPAVKYSVDVQQGSFTIKSEDFSLEQQYEITVTKGLTGKAGGELKFDFSQPVSFGQVEPTIRFFDQKEFYVSGKGSRNIQVAILNVPKVNVTVTKLYENNILQYLKSGSNYYYDEEGYDYEYGDYYYNNYNNTDDLGDVIYNQEIETASLPRKGSNRVLTLDFEDKLADNKGIYVLEIRSPDDYYLGATKMIAISDIGLIVKEGEKNFTVFANSIKTAQPLSGAIIRFIGRNNQVTFETKTDGDGMAVYSYSDLKASGFETSIITAQLDKDYNVIPLDRTRINTSRFDVGGKWKNSSNLDVFIYGDRNLYRPGETVNLTAIVRDFQWKSPGSIPVILKFVAPNGKTYKTIRKVLNNYGSFDTRIDLPATAQTGSYIAYLYTGNDVLIGSQTIKIEEFMPDRIKVDVTLDKSDYKPGETIDVNISAVNFFGPPASDRNYQVEMSTSRIYFYPKKNSGYNYTIQGALSSFSNEFRENTTDADGKGNELFDIPVEYKNMGALGSDIFVTVFDETGRPVNRLKHLTIYTQDVFYGIRSDDYYTKTGQPVSYKLIAVDKDGNDLTNVDTKVKLIRYEYKTVLSNSGGYFRYRSERVENVLQDKTIKINGTSTTFGFVPDFSGEYELRVSAPGVSTYVSSYMYAYGWGSTSYSSFKVNNEGQIDIELDKDTYNVGDKANVLFKAPFTGKILVTLETDKVIDHFYIETDKRAASFTLDIKEEYLPNVFISATLFRAHEVSDIPLTVAHGYASVKVDNPNYKMPVSIEAVEKSRSNTKQTIKIKAKPNSALTIAVVDEGILQVAGYSTPDPYNFYYQKRALLVNTSNIYPYLFPELGMVRSVTGGGADEMEKRLNPMQNNRVKLVSFWSSIIQTNGRGEAEYSIDIPQFSGDLRVMAVGYNGQVFGSAQKNIKVADPLVTSVSLPRFLSPGDEVDIPVMLTNTTDKPVKCKATLSVTGPLKIVGDNSQSVSIEANREMEVLFKVNAEYELGQGAVILKANSMGEEFINKTDITVRPASPLQKRSGGGQLEAGKSIQLAIDNKNFMESSVSGKLLLSKNPLVQYSKSLDYLVQYPYGCVEQTISSAFPQLYFGDLVGILYSKEKAKTDAIRNVQAALDRIKLMQLYNGGLTYWPGGGSECWWGSVYAAHFAVEARKAGFEVDDAFLNPLLKYLKKNLEKKELITYYYNYNQRKQIAPQEAIYSLYVLSLAGEKPTALLNYYRSRPNEMSLDCRYMLAAAYALTGDIQKAREVVPPAFEGEKSNTSFGGSFYSYIRDEALALNTMLDIDPQSQQIGLMAKHVAGALQNQRYLNTQERTFSLLALGKIARIAAGSDIKASIQVNGKVVGKFDNKDLVLSLDKIGNNAVNLTAEGTGNLYYYWECEGISTDGSYIEEDSYLRVRKSFYSRTGNLITSNQFKQNDLVLVEIALTGLTSSYVENVAVSDILPACFEIENPRLTELPPGMNYPHSTSYCDYMDIRDDRINLFVNVSEYTRYYYYLLRVVSPGKYKMGPVGADAMYNGEYHSYNGGGEIVVTRE